MRLLRIAKKDFLLVLREKASIFFMILFPIFLVIILGLALKNNFDPSVNLPKLKVRYVLNSKDEVINKNFKEYLEKVGKEINMEPTQSKNIEADKKELSNGKYIAVLDLKSDNNIDIITTKVSQTDASLVKSIVDIYLNTVKTYDSILKIDPTLMRYVHKEVDKNLKYIKTTDVNGKTSPSSIDYYSIAMFTSIGLYAIFNGMYSLSTDSSSRTLRRVSISNASNAEIIFGKLFGVMLSTFLQMGILFLFTIVVMRANWGTHYLEIIGITISLIFFSISFGIGLSSAIKNIAFAQVLMNILIPIMSFLGGSYLPVNSLGSFIKTLSVISPIKWMNDSMFFLIYGGTTNPIPITITINLVLGLFFLVLALIKNRNEVIQ